MKTEIIINVASHETRIALAEDKELVEILVERPENERMVGDIYKGVVSAVLPGMQAAFVDIGLEKSAFLHVSDMADSEEYADMFDGSNGEARAANFRRKFAPIQSILHKGEEILVQITKEPIGTKGPRITSEISLPGRFIVLVPNEELIGVSRKISNWGEKRRLRETVRGMKPDGHGIIVRTVGVDKGEKEFRSDIKTMLKVWNGIQKRAEATRAPALIHEEMGMTSGFVRDLFTDDVDRVVVDSRREYRRILKYLRAVSPHLRSRVELYRDKEPIFDAFKIEEEIEKAYNRKAWLKKGGFLIIDHTEALVTIDVNSGKFVGSTDQEDTVLKINMEAAREIARQLRLRDIGGIIVIDFIDMASYKNRRRVVEELQTALKRDRSKTSISQISEFGLVQMTRQRVRPSLLYTYSEPCPTCGGIGRVQGRDTTVTEIERWLKRSVVSLNERRFTLHVHPTVEEYLMENDRARLKLVQKATRTKIEVKKDLDLAIDSYRFFSAKRNKDLTDEFLVPLN